MFFLVQLANVEVRQPHEQANKIENTGPIIVSLADRSCGHTSTFTPALPNLQLLLLLVRKSFMRRRSVTVGQKQIELNEICRDNFSLALVDASSSATVSMTESRDTTSGTLPTPLRHCALATLQHSLLRRRRIPGHLQDHGMIMASNTSLLPVAAGVWTGP